MSILHLGHQRTGSTVRVAEVATIRGTHGGQIITARRGEANRPRKTAKRALSAALLVGVELAGEAWVDQDGLRQVTRANNCPAIRVRPSDPSTASPSLQLPSQGPTC